MKFNPWFWTFLFCISLILSSQTQAASVGVCRDNVSKGSEWIGFQKVLVGLNPKSIEAVTSDLRLILENGLKKNDEPTMGGAEFDQIYDSLVSYAEQDGIKITKTVDTIGVFPKGLYEIQTSGFGKRDPAKTNTNFAARHELAHLFHVIQVRSVLIRSMKLRGQSQFTEQEATDFLEKFEGGRNYREFEQMVTEISGLPHQLSEKLETEVLYQEKVNELLSGVKAALSTGRLNFRDKFGLLNLYALFLSRAPLIVGKSIKDLAVRLPFMIFTSQYLFNPTFREYINVLVASIK